MAIVLAQVPVGALEALADHAPAMRAKFIAGVPVDVIVAEMEPAVVALLGYVAGLLLPPPMGTVFGIVVWAVKHSRLMTFEEEQTIMARTGKDSA